MLHNFTVVRASKFFGIVLVNFRDLGKLPAIAAFVNPFSANFGKKNFHQTPYRNQIGSKLLKVRSREIGGEKEKLSLFVTRTTRCLKNAND